MIAGLLVGGALVYINQGKIEQLTPGEEAAAFQEIAEKAINYINENKDALTGGYDASLVSVEEEGDILKIRLKVAEQEYDSYVTKDGKFLFPGGYNLEETQEGASAEGETTPPETQKRDAPDVKVFVMSYCPYGLQAQKMFLPVYGLLKDKAEMGIYFVDYIMHEKQEIDENLRQYCIQKEQKEKYYDYLSCFVTDGNFEECLSQADIDRTELAVCISNTDQEYNITGQYNDKSTWVGSTCPEPPYCFPKFDVQGDLNERYGVQGSPTVVINDEIVNLSSRSPEKFKEAVCQAFNTPPSECDQTLSDAAFSPGFGLETGSSSGGQCQ